MNFLSYLLQTNMKNDNFMLFFNYIIKREYDTIKHTLVFYYLKNVSIDNL
jgi:hypothetical protein